MHPLVALFLLVALGAVVQSDEGGNCSQPYIRFSDNHTLCLPENKECDRKDNSISDDNKKLVLKLHNDYRSKVATGKAKLPKAGDMLQMEWDDELADIAQKLANQCESDYDIYDCERCRRVQNFEVGQNIRHNKFDKESDGTTWEQVMKIWYEEIKEFNKSLICAYDSDAIEESDFFSQMIWAKTWRVGCGYTLYKERKMLHEIHVCNYGPKGNNDGRPVYLQDTAVCGMCPANTCCKGKCDRNDGPNYEGLCKVMGKDGEYDDDESHHHHPIYYNYPLHYCNFDSPRECDVETPDNMKQWNVTKTKSGSFAEIILNPNKKSILKFTKPIRAASRLCIRITSRRGANRHQGKTLYNLNLITRSTDGKTESKRPFGKLSPNFINDYFEYSNTKKMQISIEYIIGKDASTQYMEVKELLVKEGYCTKQQQQC